MFNLPILCGRIRSTTHGVVPLPQQPNCAARVDNMMTQQQALSSKENSPELKNLPRTPISSIAADTGAEASEVNTMEYIFPQLMQFQSSTSPPKSTSHVFDNVANTPDGRSANPVDIAHKDKHLQLYQRGAFRIYEEFAQKMLEDRSAVNYGDIRTDAEFEKPGDKTISIMNVG